MKHLLHAIKNVMNILFERCTKLIRQRHHNIQWDPNSNVANLHQCSHKLKHIWCAYYWIVCYLFSLYFSLRSSLFTKYFITHNTDTNEVFKKKKNKIQYPFFFQTAKLFLQHLLSLIFTYQTIFIICFLNKMFSVDHNRHTYIWK